MVIAYVEKHEESMGLSLELVKLDFEKYVTAVTVNFKRIEEGVLAKCLRITQSIDVDLVSAPKKDDDEKKLSNSSTNRPPI